MALVSFSFVIAFLFYHTACCCHALQQQPLALLTGATGTTGQLVTNLLLEQGYQVRIFCRNQAKAQGIFGDSENNNIEFCQGELNNPLDIQRAFEQTPQKKLTHIIYMAGGESADYKIVNYQGVANFAKQAALCENDCRFVVVSTAWASKPYSIASLLFNTFYNPDTVPMASHYLGEQAVRRAAAASTTTRKSRFTYVILRAGGLTSDARYNEKYPEAATMGLTYQQGDDFEFLGIAGRPGMSKSQLAHAIVTATNLLNDDNNGQGYTVEVTGSGSTGWDDASVYQDQLTPDAVALITTSSEHKEEVRVYEIHTNAVAQMKKTVLGASIGAIGLIGMFGWFPGLLYVLALDGLILFVWSALFANRQVS